MRLLLISVAFVAPLLLPAGAGAVPLIATDGSSLARFDSATPGDVATVPLTGLQPGETLAGIDTRALDGGLYGIGRTSRVYSIDASTGAATAVGTAPFLPLLSGTAFGIDFNPVTDRVREVSNTEQNMRINPSTGAVAANDTPLNPAGNVVAAAYTNNQPGAVSTTLYDIDSASGNLVLQGSVNGAPASPNSGALVSVGSLGLGGGLNPAIGFDITPVGVAFASITTGGISRLYTVNLGSATATLVGAIGNGSTPYLGLTAAAAPTTLQFGLAEESAHEGGDATLVVTRTGRSTGAVTVEYSTEPGNAAAGADFTPTSGTLSWAAGDVDPKAISVSVRADSAAEGAESFTVALSNPTGSSASVGTPASATVRIEPSAALPGNDARRPRLRVFVSSQRIGTAMRKGVAFVAATDEACTLGADVLIARRLARRLRIPRRIAQRRTGLGPGGRLFRAKPSAATAAKLRRRRRVRVTVSATCSDGARNTATVNRRATLKRR